MGATLLFGDAKRERVEPLSEFDSSHFGDPAGTRTLDTRLKRAMLYQLSYWII